MTEAISTGLVLLIEPEPNHRRYLADLLEWYGYRVQAPEGPDDSNGVLRSEDFELIVCDWRHIDGLRGAGPAEENALGGGRKPPLIVTTPCGTYPPESLSTFPILEKPYRISEVARVLSAITRPQGE